jgi:hypothetical protein
MDVLAAKSFVPIYRLPAGGFAVLTVSSDRGNRVLRKALGARDINAPIDVSGTGASPIRRRECGKRRIKHCQVGE